MSVGGSYMPAPVLQTKYISPQAFYGASNNTDSDGPLTHYLYPPPEPNALSANDTGMQSKGMQSKGCVTFLVLQVEVWYCNFPLLSLSCLVYHTYMKLSYTVHRHLLGCASMHLGCGQDINTSSRHMSYMHEVHLAL